MKYVRPNEWNIRPKNVWQGIPWWITLVLVVVELTLVARRCSHEPEVPELVQAVD